MLITFQDFLQQLITSPPLAITVLLTLGVIMVNGWTDAPNAIATCVATRSISPRIAVIMAAAFAVTAIMLHQSWIGRRLFAIGGNREASRLSGIPVAPLEVFVYMVCSVLAGVAGLIHSSQLYSAEPASGSGFELNAIAAVVVGGTSFTGGIGSMPGTLLGAIIIGILDKGLNQAGVHFSLQYVVKGLVILGAVYADVRRRK